MFLNFSQQRIICARRDMRDTLTSLSNSR